MAKGKVIKQAIPMSGRRGAHFNPHTKPVVFQSMAGLRETVKRNDPCPCGSGKKYKHCHKYVKQNAGKQAVKLEGEFTVPPCGNTQQEQT